MATHHPAQDSDPNPDLDQPRAARVLDQHQRVAAAERLLGSRPGASSGAVSESLAMARRFVDQANRHGIDFALAWATHDPGVRQVCLAVIGSGKTAMLFLSGPGPTAGCGTENTQKTERIACLRACVKELADASERPVSIVQALPAPQEDWSRAAMEAAGFTWVGDLAYMRRKVKKAERGGKGLEWRGSLPDGLTIRSVKELMSEGPIDPILIEALEKSYEDTLDCPALCGMRTTHDVLDSHRMTGVWDPSAWWVVMRQGRPAGCMLLNHTPEHSSVELVYIGLGSEVRGKGLATLLLDEAVRHTARLGMDELTCAVDEANEPALKLYAKHGFEAFASRVAFVHPIATKS